MTQKQYRQHRIDRSFHPQLVLSNLCTAISSSSSPSSSFLFGKSDTVSRNSTLFPVVGPLSFSTLPNHSRCSCGSVRYNTPRLRLDASVVHCSWLLNDYRRLLIGCRLVVVSIDTHHHRWNRFVFGLLWFGFYLVISLWDYSDLRLKRYVQRESEQKRSEREGDRDRSRRIYPACKAAKWEGRGHALPAGSCGELKRKQE